MVETQLVNFHVLLTNALQMLSCAKLDWGYILQSSQLLHILHIVLYIMSAFVSHKATCSNPSLLSQLGTPSNPEP